MPIIFIILSWLSNSAIQHKIRVAFRAPVEAKDKIFDKMRVFLLLLKIVEYN